jgi:1,4-alpha-glucan branching enzyme
LRAYFAFMWAHPGKKLLFMGGEFAQTREWNHDGELDWGLLSDPSHAGVQQLVGELNRLYRSEPALHQRDAESSGFQWIVGNDALNSVYAYERHAADAAPPIIIVVNMTPVPRHGYRIGVPREGFWRERINTDSELYGGSNLGNAGGVHAAPIPAHGRAQSLELTLPPLAALILTHAD